MPVSVQRPFKVNNSDVRLCNSFDLHLYMGQEPEIAPGLKKTLGGGEKTIGEVQEEDTQCFINKKKRFQQTATSGRCSCVGASFLPVFIRSVVWGSWIISARCQKTFQPTLTVSL